MTEHRGKIEYRSEREGSPEGRRWHITMVMHFGTDIVEDQNEQRNENNERT